jgi:signal transduction histidine kinase
VLSQICEAAVRLMDRASAAGVARREGEHLAICGSYGFGDLHQRIAVPYDCSFAALVIERDRTAFLEDTALRPDLCILHPPASAPPRSLLASPLRIGGKTVGVLEIYSQSPRRWSEEEFRFIEWLGAQSALVLEAMQLQNDLERRRRDAEEDAVRKTRFLTAISHDVRTPANAISLLAELIQRSADNPAALGEIPEMARDLQANSKALVELVSDVLDVARFDSGQFDLQKSSFELSATLNAEVRQLMPLAINKGIRLIVEPLSQPLWLHTDRIKLARVISNLVANAIKFTETGSVTIRTRSNERGMMNEEKETSSFIVPPSSLFIEVIDTGIGISAEHQARIFDEFFQLRNPERDRAKGTGLGLAICKRLVDAMGCSLSVASRLGHGSTFTLTLPADAIVPAPAGNGASLPQRSVKGPLSSMRILLVEDHDITRRATALLLAAEGATVLQAENGRTALHMLAHDDPHVLLLDLMLPDIDGADILRTLQEQRPPSLRRILAVSGDATPARLQEVLRLGADALVPKPLDIRTLVTTLAQNPLPVG